jgi:hypothetical protein
MVLRVVTTSMVVRPPVVLDKEQVIHSAHGPHLFPVPLHRARPLSPSTANLDDDSNIKLTEAVVALSVIVRRRGRAGCAASERGNPSYTIGSAELRIMSALKTEQVLLL